MKNPPTPESLFFYKVKVFFATDSVRLLEILKDSSDKNRDFLIAYLLLLIYVLATVFSTTDIQLLVVTETFKLNPAAWLKETLEKLPIWPNSRIDELLPLTPEQIDAIKQTLPERTKW